ncbi:hypothetical protein KAW38_04005 [Candidatus Micrarchaeota archaeon]|nr:hypothetical protein [Candidatus Micrarchaeota archaeon]
MVIKKMEEEEKKAEGNFKSFLNRPAVKNFVDTWGKGGKFKKAGITELTRALFFGGGGGDDDDTEDKVLKESADVLSKLDGDSHLYDFLKNLKLKPEGMRK